MNIAFAIRMLDFGQQRVVVAQTVLPCGCQLEHAAASPAEPQADWPKNDGKSKLVLIQWLQRAAAAHDHRAYVIGQVTARLKQ